MKKYSINLLTSVLVVMVFVAGFNWLVNPYEIFDSPEIEGFNKNKSEIERFTRLSKTYKVKNKQPELLFLASSRGLVVPDSFLNVDGMSGFNMSLASASTYELWRMLQHTQAVHPLHKVILGLDERFSVAKQANFIENRLLVNSDGTKNSLLFKQQWHDMFSSLVSFSALRSSLRTIKKQEEVTQDKIKKAGGHRQMFRKMEASIFTGYSVSLNKCNTNSEKRVDVDTEAAQYFEKIVDFSYANSIELIIYFSPVHARFYEVNCMAGLWDNMEQMKRMVVTVVDRKAKQYGKDTFTVWDFSGYNSITSEELPEPGDVSSIMQWYWEGSHYTKKTAALVLKTISGEATEHSDFGVSFTSQNIEKHLQDINLQRNKYVADHAAEISELQSLMESTIH